MAIRSLGDDDEALSYSWCLTGKHTVLASFQGIFEPTCCFLVCLLAIDLVLV